MRNGPLKRAKRSWDAEFRGWLLTARLVKEKPRASGSMSRFGRLSPSILGARSHQKKERSLNKEKDFCQALLSSVAHREKFNKNLLKTANRVNRALGQEN
jgi:hypothetical protein